MPVGTRHGVPIDIPDPKPPWKADGVPIDIPDPKPPW